MEQGSPEWHAARIGKLTASRFPDLMATLKSGKPAQGYLNVVWDAVVERMTQTKTETFQSAWMTRGIELEPLAREAYSDAMLVAVHEEAIVVHPEHDFITCSPDGLVGDDGLVEFKCPTPANHGQALLNGSHVGKYYWQCIGQMYVCQRQWCDLVSYHPDFPEGLQLAIQRIERNEDDIEKLEKTCLMAEQDIQDLIVNLEELRK